MQYRRFAGGFAVVIVGAMVLAGCTPNRSVEGDRSVQTGNLLPSAASAGASEKSINITPYLALDRYAYYDNGRCGPSGPPYSDGDRKCFIVDDRFVDTYTRLEIHGFDDTGHPVDGTGQDVYPYQTRDMVRRLVAGRRTAFTLTAKVSVGDFQASVPLVSIDHTSDSNVGEQFQRIVFHRVGDFPLFLVRRDGANSVVSALFTVHASDDYQTHAVSDLIKTVQTVATQLSPAVPVLTTLTSADGQKFAATMDATLGHLFSSSIEETQRTDDDIYRWGDRVKVSLRIPSVDQDWTAIPSQSVGSWKITFANPRPSIFSDIELCPFDIAYDAKTGAFVKQIRPGNPRCRATFDQAAADIRAEVKADEVLSFHLAGLKSGIDTIGKYLVQQDWYNKALTDIVARGAKGQNADSVQSFCRTIRGTIAGLGLSSLDAGIVVVAAREGLDINRAVVEAMRGNGDCGYAPKG